MENKPIRIAPTKLYDVCLMLVAELRRLQEVVGEDDYQIIENLLEQTRQTLEGKP